MSEEKDLVRANLPKPTVEVLKEPPKADVVIDVPREEVVHVNDLDLRANLWGREISLKVTEKVYAFLEHASRVRTYWRRITRRLGHGESYTLPIKSFAGEHADNDLRTVFAGVSEAIGGELNLDAPTFVRKTLPSITFYYSAGLTGDTSEMVVAKGQGHEGGATLCRTVTQGSRGGRPFQVGLEPLFEDEKMANAKVVPDFTEQEKEEIKGTFGFK